MDTFMFILEVIFREKDSIDEFEYLNIFLIWYIVYYIYIIFKIFMK